MLSPRRTIITLAVFGAMSICAAANAALVTKTYSFPVPDVPYEKDGKGGWGSIIMKFDRPITGGSFVFEPECHDPTAGTLKPGDDTTIKLGPGNYKLLGTGSIVSGGTFDGQDRKKLEITITYDDDPDPTEPTLLLGPNDAPTSFWKSKSGFAYLAASDLPIPEPSTLAVCAAGAFALLARRRRR